MLRALVSWLKSAARPFKGCCVFNSKGQASMYFSLSASCTSLPSGRSHPELPLKHSYGKDSYLASWFVDIYFIRCCYQSLSLPTKNKGKHVPCVLLISGMMDITRTMHLIQDTAKAHLAWYGMPLCWFAHSAFPDMRSHEVQTAWEHFKNRSGERKKTLNKS